MSTNAARHKARRFAVQALYQWRLTDQAANEIEAQFRADQDMKNVDVDYFHDLLSGVIAEHAELDAQFKPFLDRSINSLDPVSVGILRLGAFELAQRIEVPYKVVINEAVALAKTFGPTDSHKFVNGILDKTAQALRPEEVAAAKAG